MQWLSATFTVNTPIQVHWQAGAVMRAEAGPESVVTHRPVIWRLAEEWLRNVRKSGR